MGCRGLLTLTDVFRTDGLWQQGARPQDAVMSSVSGQFASVSVTWEASYRPETSPKGQGTRGGAGTGLVCGLCRLGLQG